MTNHCAIAAISPCRISQEAIDAWRAPKTGKRGAQPVYADIAIETAITFRLLFRLPLRQTEGFLGSVLILMDLTLPYPDHTTLSQRNAIVAIRQQIERASEGPISLIVHVIAYLAEGLGVRGTARVFEIDPNTVLNWLVEAAEQLNAFSAYFLHELQINQVQLDELYVVLSAVRDGGMSEAEAIEQLSRLPHWVWTAIDPESKLLLSVQEGDRTLATAQAVLHQIAQLLAPSWVPLFLSDGNPHYLPAIVAHFGHWVQRPRRQARGPAPKPHWMPLLSPGHQL